MAIVKLRFVKHVQNLVRYVMSEKGANDPMSVHDVDEQDPIKDFRAMAEFHKGKGTITALHIVQSWDTDDSKKLAPIEFNALGKELVEAKFPGHAYAVVTHTDTGKVHNHIVVSPWHSETGEKIENKRHHVYKLRSIGDSLCKERGLSVLEGAAKDRQARLPNVVQKIAKFNGRSWLLDLCQKADFARAYATSYDEYAGILGEFGVTVRSEKKNITYFYGSRDRGKRGSKLGRIYDKPGLEESFKANDQRFARVPGLRGQVRGVLDSLTSGTASHDVAKAALKSLRETTYAPGQKDYAAFSKVPRSGREQRFAHELDVSHLVIPMAEIRRARNANILQYCRDNSIALEKTSDRKQVLKGRTFVEVKDHEWVNHRNRTKGSLIEFVAAHKDMTFLQAIAEINRNSRLLLLEQYLGEVKRPYNSFYIPKEKRLREQEAHGKLTKLLSHHGVYAGNASILLRSGQAQVTQHGVIRLFGKDDEDGALEFSERENGAWYKSKVGTPQRPFFTAGGGNKKAALYLDPFSFLKAHGNRALSPSGHSSDVLCLMAPNGRAVDLFLTENRHVRDLHVFMGDHATSPEAIDFFDTLKAKYAPFGIEVTQGRGLELSQGREREGPSL